MGLDALDERCGVGVDGGDPGAQLGGERVHVGGVAGVQLGELALELLCGGTVRARRLHGPRICQAVLETRSC
jgi:hypothetical protein